LKKLDACIFILFAAPRKCLLQPFIWIYSMSGSWGWTGRDDLIGLTLWLMYERVQGEKSPWQPYLKMFPQSTLSPLLWTPEEQQRLLKGSPALGNSPRGSLLFTGNLGAIKDRILFNFSK
jgi:hypothetical protein